MSSFDQLDVKGYKLKPVETTLFDFMGHIVYMKGEIMLPLTVEDAQD